MRRRSTGVKMAMSGGNGALAGLRDAPDLVLPWDVARYALAVVFPLAMTGLLAFLLALTGFPFLLAMLPAALLPALIGGRGPAIVAGVLSYVLANLTLVSPVGEFTMEPRMWSLAVACALPTLVVEWTRWTSRRRAG